MFALMKSIFFRYQALLRIRFSPFFLKTWLLFKPRTRHKLQLQERYYHDLIGRLRSGNHKVLDIGANEGFVTKTFLDANLEVFAIEPDPRNIRILLARFGANKRFRLYPCISGSESGTSILYLQTGGSAFSTANVKWKKLLESGQYRLQSSFNEQGKAIRSVTLDELISEHGIFSFIKIDVEGYEHKSLDALSTKIPLICFEANLPEFIDETLECIKKLHMIDADARFNYSSSFVIGSPAFLGFDQFEKLVQSLQLPNIDVICRMSNYEDFYDMQAGLT
jgi:FkbM family methyltransferase